MCESILFTNIKEMLHATSGVPRIWQGGGQEFFFSDFEICMPRSDMLRMAKPCALLGVVRGHAPPRKFFKMVQFGAFWCIF